MEGFFYLFSNSAAGKGLVLTDFNLYFIINYRKSGGIVDGCREIRNSRLSV